ncbi:MAG TPA: RodZ domain-containing protein [Candidatus Acidoferrales bacterium]|nr:RodZ domain-containing protein [Candidatus Acidoferrales bacterium]
MEALGEQLRTARTKLGLTAAAVANTLRIRTSFVEAMEREDWSVLGAPVYVRGFLRNYAKLLGLNAEDLVELLPEDQRVVVQPPEPPTTAIATSGYSMRDVRAQRWYPWLLGSLTVIAAFLVVQVGVGMFGMMFLSSKNSADSLGPQAPAALPVESNLASTGNTGNTLQATAAAQSRNGVNLRLQLTQPSWLSVTVDGKRVVYETLPAGTVREFHGDREILLRAGNAGGVVANFDGKDLGTLGTAGQVQDRVFAAKTPVDQLTGAHE